MRTLCLATIPTTLILFYMATPAIGKLMALPPFIVLITVAMALGLLMIMAIIMVLLLTPFLAVFGRVRCAGRALPGFSVHCPDLNYRMWRQQQRRRLQRTLSVQEY